jgi:hypothetical protein
MPDVPSTVDDVTTSSLGNSPTLLETQLDSISLQLWRMKSRVENADLLDHLTESERDKLSAALERAEQNLQRLNQTLRASEAS